MTAGRSIEHSIRFLACLTAAVIITQVLCACDYARMREDEAVQTYQAAMPPMPKQIIPIMGGDAVLKSSKPDDLKNPVPNTPDSARTGLERYGFYCIQCHGPRADGNGIVGQSFAPLPTDLGNPAVQAQSDGMLFYTISFGYKRHPPLAETIAEEHRWDLVNYLRSLRSVNR